MWSVYGWGTTAISYHFLLQSRRSSGDFKEEKASEAKAALAKWSRLQAEVELLEKKESVMVEGELKNISDLKTEESLQGGPSPGDFLFDVNLETLSLKTGFDCSNITFAPNGIPIEGLDTSPNAYIVPMYFPIYYNPST